MKKTAPRRAAAGQTAGNRARKFTDRKKKASREACRRPAE